MLNLLLLVILSVSSQAFDHSHKSFDEVLQKHVHFEGAGSSVSYKALKENPERLDTYLSSLEKVTNDQYRSWTENQKLAFLINAYNGFTLKLIKDNYPVKSIKKLGGFLSSPWKKKFFKLFGERRHLDYIEHDVIRKKFDEPRIHFALVCAAKSCPRLHNRAYVAAKLDEQLEMAARNFLLDKKNNRYNREKQTLEISSIFKWYGDDFNKSFGSHEKYIVKFLPEASEYKNVKYLDYDWGLNEKL